MITNLLQPTIPRRKVSKCPHEGGLGFVEILNRSIQAARSRFRRPEAMLVDSGRRIFYWDSRGGNHMMTTGLYLEILYAVKLAQSLVL